MVWILYFPISGTHGLPHIFHHPLSHVLTVSPFLSPFPHSHSLPLIILFNPSSSRFDPPICFTHLPYQVLVVPALHPSPTVSHYLLHYLYSCSGDLCVPAHHTLAAITTFHPLPSPGLYLHVSSTSSVSQLHPLPSSISLQFFSLSPLSTSPSLNTPHLYTAYLLCPVSET